MSRKIFIAGLFILAAFSYASAQKVIVDSTFTSKYLVKEESNQQRTVALENDNEDLTFGDRAVSIGMGILNRLKARLNLEEAAESLRNKKDRYLGNKDENEEQVEGS